MKLFGDFSFKKATRNPDRGDFRNEKNINFQKKIENEIAKLEKEKVGVEIIAEFNEKKEKYSENTEDVFKKRWELLEEIKAKYEIIDQAV